MLKLASAFTTVLAAVTLLKQLRWAQKSRLQARWDHPRETAGPTCRQGAARRVKMPSGNGRKGKRLAGKPLHHFYICCNKNQEAAIGASRCTS